MEHQMNQEFVFINLHRYLMNFSYCDKRTIVYLRNLMNEEPVEVNFCFANILETFRRYLELWFDDGPKIIVIRTIKVLLSLIKTENNIKRLENCGCLISIKNIHGDILNKWCESGEYEDDDSPFLSVFCALLCKYIFKIHRIYNQNNVQLDIPFFDHHHFKKGLEYLMRSGPRVLENEFKLNSGLAIGLSLKKIMEYNEAFIGYFYQLGGIHYCIEWLANSEFQDNFSNSLSFDLCILSILLIGIHHPYFPKVKRNLNVSLIGYLEKNMDAITKNYLKEESVSILNSICSIFILLIQKDEDTIAELNSLHGELIFQDLSVNEYLAGSGCLPNLITLHLILRQASYRRPENEMDIINQIKDLKTMIRAFGQVRMSLREQRIRR